MRRSSGRVILEGRECGERLVLGDADEVWLYTRTLFECENASVGMTFPWLTAWRAQNGRAV